MGFSLDGLIHLNKLIDLSRLNDSDLEKLKESYISYIKEIDTLLEKKSGLSRLQNYLERTSFRNIHFLYYNLMYAGRDNTNGSLTRDRLFFLNKEGKRLAQDYGITSSSDLSYVLHNPESKEKRQSLLENDSFNDLWKRTMTLAYLDEIFQDQANCINYQGTYVTFQYVKNYLERVLKDDSLKSDDELIYQDYTEKLNLVTENIVPIASELLKVRNMFSGSRLSNFNMALSKIAHKKEGSSISKKQRFFIETIAYGTTLEKLKSEDYSDAKQLIYLPYKK